MQHKPFHTQTEQYELTRNGNIPTMLEHRGKSGKCRNNFSIGYSIFNNSIHIVKVSKLQLTISSTSFHNICEFVARWFHSSSGADPGFDRGGGAQIVTGLKLPFWGLSFVEFWCWGLIFGGQGGPGPPGPPLDPPLLFALGAVFANKQYIACIKHN